MLPCRLYAAEETLRQAPEGQPIEGRFAETREYAEARGGIRCCPGAGAASDHTALKINICLLDLPSRFH